MWARTNTNALLSLHTTVLSTQTHTHTLTRVLIHGSSFIFRSAICQFDRRSSWWVLTSTFFLSPRTFPLSDLFTLLYYGSAGCSDDTGVTVEVLDLIFCLLFFLRFAYDSCRLVGVVTMFQKLNVRESGAVGSHSKMFCGWGSLTVFHWCHHFYGFYGLQLCRKRKSPTIVSGLMYTEGCTW